MLKKLGIRIFSALAMLNITAPQASIAAEVTQETVFKDRPAIVLKGKIEAGDFEKVRSAARRLAANNDQIIISLNSPGGDFIEAIRIGEFIRKLNA